MRGSDHTESYRAQPALGTGAGVDSTPKKSLQHTLNNPLAGLLAELQLLEMEDLPEHHRQAVERCVTLTRRVIQIVRDEVPKEL